ncbi:MAG: DUF2948 family protein [Hyphomicrobium sp.]|nr:DUF2948 family protein [Hyphomicrobium sp.]
MTARDIKPLKLIAFDAEDLAILAAHLQDAVVKVSEITFLKAERRFALVLNRFDWADALGPGPKSRLRGFVRRQTGLRFEHVGNVKLAGIDRTDSKQILSLLTLQFEPGSEPPEGRIILNFAGGGMIRLDVDCVEAEMRDLGAAWQTLSKPSHPDGRPDDAPDDGTV